MNGEMEVFSFVAADPLTSWSADIKEFWTYLSDQQGYPATSQYLISRHLVLCIDSLDPTNFLLRSAVRHRAFYRRGDNPHGCSVDC